MRNLFRGMVCVLVLAFGIAACGGGGGTTTTDGTTTAATSTQTVAATSKIMMVGYETYAQLLAQFGGVAAVSSPKAEGISFTCDTSVYSSFLCTGTDLRGGYCTVSSSGFNNVTTFTMSYDCTNFHPDSDTVINGAFAVQITLYNGPASSTSVGFFAASTDANKAETAGECAIADDATSFDDGSCNEGGTCTSGSTNLVAILEFTVGNNGLTVTDSCGTFAYGSDFVVSEDLCINPTTLVMGFTMDGTLNSEVIDYSSSWTCSYVM